ncbi:hypothetical protein E8E13_005986 [Curvularia kusanoi]|uniref:Apple domain-containing protein n=1 Tax=Curvularia kusanoi TaxID=90978 RepID=A0A9P4TEC3_CURKU|nr:hypothetical protein E8E13_005986 [Curvularia kusanoi]
MCTYMHDGVSLQVNCTTSFEGGFEHVMQTPTLAGCMEACALNEDCIASNYNGQDCSLKSHFDNIQTNDTVTGVNVLSRPITTPDPTSYITVTATPTPTEPPLNYIGEQILPNPGFEESHNPWAFDDNYQYYEQKHLKIVRSSADAYRGNYSLQILQVKYTGPWEFEMEQWVPIKMGGRYAVSLAVREPTEQCKVEVYWQLMEIPGMNCVTTTGWRECTSFMPGSYTDNVKEGLLVIWVSCPEGAAGRFFIDDVKMTEILEPKCNYVDCGHWDWEGPNKPPPHDPAEDLEDEEDIELVDGW